MFDAQSFASEASSYKTVTYTKHMTKRRGRACTRHEKRNVTTAARVTRDQLAANYSFKEFDREMKRFEKTVSEAAGRGIHDIPMPEFLTTLRDNANLHESNLTMAKISDQAMDKFPPLR